MIKKLGWCVWLACLGVLGGMEPAYAQRTAPVFSSGAETPRQTVNFTIGLFSLFGEDSRVDGDALVANRDFLTFDIEDFRHLTYGAEWLIPIGNFVEAGAGVSFYQRTVPSVYTEFIDEDLTEIDQDLTLRQMPLSFTVRAVPFGQDSPVQPYVGGGIALINWRYTESGEFIGENDQIFVGDFEDSGWSTGWLFLGGVRVITGRAAIGGEFRYQKASGDLSDEFFGPKIDLGGWTVQGTIGFRF